MLKQIFKDQIKFFIEPAAFRRLCVETSISAVASWFLMYQPPSGGCVLKLPLAIRIYAARYQPPSGGCVLKLVIFGNTLPAGAPAAFRRLCVETSEAANDDNVSYPAAFRRLCVETFMGDGSGRA